MTKRRISRTTRRNLVRSKIDNPFCPVCGFRMYLYPFVSKENFDILSEKEKPKNLSANTWM